MPFIIVYSAERNLRHSTLKRAKIARKMHPDPKLQQAKKLHSQKLLKKVPKKRKIHRHDHLKQRIAIKLPRKLAKIRHNLEQL